MAYGKREVAVGSLLLGNDKNYVFADNFFLFLVNNKHGFLLANAGLLKISVFIFF